MGKPSAVVKPNMHNSIPIKHTNVIPTKHWSHSTKYNAFWFQCYVVCLWGQWGSNQNDYQRSKSTMRHVSRAHRVALDWLFDRISLDLKIQIRYIDSKHQLADILTKRNFTRDEWNNQSSSFVQNQPFQLHLLHQEFQLDERLHNGEEDTRSERTRMNCVQVAASSDEFNFFYCDKFLRRIESDCI